MPSSGSQHSMSYVAESTYGTTPTTPTMKAIRQTGTTLGLSKSTLQSNEQRDDRQVAAYKHGNSSASGDISFELTYATFDDFLEALLGGTWSTDTLKAGTTRRSFTIQRKHADISTFLTFTGAEVNTMSLSVAPNQMVTGSFGIIAKAQALAEVTSPSYSAANTNTPFDSFTGSITEGGSGISVVTSLTLNIDNGLEPQFVVGSSTTIRPSIGNINVTGSMQVHFENTTLMAKFINETASSLVLVLTDVDSNSYTITLPNIKYSTGQPDTSGDGPITLSMNFIALYDSGSGTNIQIDRA